MVSFHRKPLKFLRKLA